MAIDSKGNKIIEQDKDQEQVELSKRLEELRRKKLEAIERLKQKYKESMTYKRPVVKGSKHPGKKPPFIKSGKIFTEPIAHNYVRKYEPILSEEEIEFLKESNLIDNEPGEDALKSAKVAWAYAKNYRKRIRMDYLKRIYLLMMNKKETKGHGEFRRNNLWVGSKTHGYTKCLHPSKVRAAILDFIEKTPGMKKLKKQDMYYTLPEIDEKLVRESHVKLVQIYPFMKGTERFCRILMNVQRLNLKLPLLIIHQGKEEEEYYKWFGKFPKGKYHNPPKNLITPKYLNNK